MKLVAVGGYSKRGVLTEFDKMDVSTLREKLESASLDLEGTRETLVQRLKDHDHA